MGEFCKLDNTLFGKCMIWHKRNLKIDHKRLGEKNTDVDAYNVNLLTYLLIGVERSLQ